MVLIVDWIESFTEKGKYYTVSFENGKVNCDCPHYQFRLKGTPLICKHIRKLISEVLKIKT